MMSGEAEHQTGGGERMKNREKWAQVLIECALSADTTALKNGRPVICTKMQCHKCDMYEVCCTQGGDGCAVFLHEWAEQEAEEGK